MSTSARLPPKSIKRHHDRGANAEAVPPFPTVVMVRILLIQRLFNLCDEQMEFQLLERLRFQRFAGLRDTSQIPGRTIWTFEVRIKAAGGGSLFEAVANSKDIVAMSLGNYSTRA